MKIFITGKPGSGKGTVGHYLAEKLGLREISMGAVLRARMKKDPAFARLVKKYMVAGKLLPDSLMNKIAKDYFEKKKIKDNFIFDGYPRTLKEARFIVTLFDFDHVIELNVTDKEIVERIMKRMMCGSKSYIIGKRYPITSKRLQNERKKQGKSTSSMMIKPGGLCPSTGKPLERRSDDAPLKIKTRLQEYRNKTRPILKFFKAYANCLKDENKVIKEKYSGAELKRRLRKIPHVHIVDGQGPIKVVQKRVLKLLK